MNLMKMRRNDPSNPASVTLSFEGAKDFVRFWASLKNRYVGLRGFTIGENTKAVPRTTISDVVQLADAWSRELRRAHNRPGYAREREKWQDVLAEIDVAVGRGEHDEYRDNQRFWSATASLAIYLDSTKNLPSRWDLMVDSVGEAVAELPETLGSVASSAASGAALVSREAGRLLGGLTTPILIGAGAVAALVLLQHFSGRARR